MTDLAALRRKAAPHLVGAFVLLHLVAIFVLGSPAVQGAALDKKVWKQPAVQAELDAWGDRLRALGVDATDEELEARLFDLATTWTAARDGALKPFKPYARYLGAGQAWQLFVAPQVFTSTVTLDVEVDGAWRTVFADNDPAHRWNAAKLEHDRVQSMFFWFGFQERRKDRASFAAWAAREAARDFPGATRVRMRVLRTKTPSVEEARAGVVHPAKYEKELVVPVPRSAP